jgi:general secretion pathway protein F
LLQAASAACNVLGNRHLAAGVRRAIGEVREGSSLRRALDSERLLPTIALRMIAVGEEAGKLDQMLLRIAAMFEQETRRNIDRFMTIPTPLRLWSVAVLVGSPTRLLRGDPEQTELLPCNEKGVAVR